MRTIEELKSQFMKIPEEAVRYTQEELAESKKVITDFIKGYVGDRKAIIGLSGGIDSSLIAYLTVDALGKDNVLGVLLPSDSTTAEDTAHANRVAEYLGIEPKEKNITPDVESVMGTSDVTFPDEVTERIAIGNVKARLRMIHLYAEANVAPEGGMVVGTDNRTEGTIGYFTKYGDGGVDINPIGDLYKTQVRQLSEAAGVPKEIIDKSPTAGLWNGQTDEGELGITYDKLDQMLLGFDLGYNDDFISETIGVGLDDMKRIKEMVGNNSHKSEVPKSVKIMKV